ncbi:MAG TPA: sigma-54 dependent transcriptional regulator [Verrucomicrobiota bacterium]|nr:sigma-54 dependent transcriptional regulator [Verrucomicrobiota bacterium]
MTTNATLPCSGSVLVVDDIPANRNLLRETLEPSGYEVLLAADGEMAIKVAQRAHPDLVLLDVVMPGLDGFAVCRRLKQIEATRAVPVIFLTAKDEPRSVLEGFEAGGVDYITRPFQAEEVLARVRTHLENHRLTRAVIAQKEELETINQQLRAEIERRERAEGSLQLADQRLSILSAQEAKRWGIEALVGTSVALQRIVEDVRRLQTLPGTPVLIVGESGTGKELIARAIHYGSAQSKAPFLAVNCSAVPQELAESLFFGHLKGAFSGAARDEKGYFENAHGGTLFLDEIGDMPLWLQAKLLRVLESGAIMPLGASSERAVEVRVLAATNSNLQAELAAGKFRKELYFRLTHFVLNVPPLRERREDIALLAAHFLNQLAAEMGMPPPRFSATALEVLGAYDYPGNVRELRNLVERAVIESGGGEIQPGHLHFVFASAPAANVEPARSGPPMAQIAPGHPVAIASDETERILAFVREQGSINNAQCRELLGVGMHRAWYLLRQLHRAGVLKQDSSGRWAHYRLA